MDIEMFPNSKVFNDVSHNSTHANKKIGHNHLQYLLSFVTIDQEKSLHCHCPILIFEFPQFMADDIWLIIVKLYITQNNLFQPIKHQYK